MAVCTDCQVREISEIGDWCFAIGHPGGFEKERGIVVVRLGRE